MISDDLRRRISLLNRSAPRGPSRFSHHLTGSLPFGLPEGQKNSGRTVGFLELDQAMDGRVISASPSRFFLVEKQLTGIHHTAEHFMDRYRFCFQEGNLPPILDEWRESLVEHEPFRWLYLDIECCGLSNSPVFLVGLMQFSGPDFNIQQLFARDYSEEAAMLNYLASKMGNAQVLITFNGKSFDLPFLIDRSSVNGIQLPRLESHFDVLHAARRRWGREMPNCKLQTLERYICRRMRRGDIPGMQIPDAYHAFVKTGNAVRIVDILHHNMLDLITMAELTLKLFETADDRGWGGGRAAMSADSVGAKHLSPPRRCNRG